MAEFGHETLLLTDGTCIDGWGAGPLIIEVGTVSFRFEDSDRFGPSRVNHKGEIAKNPFFAERSPFWRAHTLWVQQGRRLKDNKCQWDDEHAEA